VQILILPVTLVVIAVPKGRYLHLWLPGSDYDVTLSTAGLPLAVTLALAFAIKRMTKENLLVRVLGSCETMARPVLLLRTRRPSLLVQSAFTPSLFGNAMRTRQRAGKEATNRPNAKDFAVDILNLNSTLTLQLVELLNASIAINSTAFEDVRVRVPHLPCRASLSDWLAVDSSTEESSSIISSANKSSMKNVVAFTLQHRASSCP